MKGLTKMVFRRKRGRKKKHKLANIEWRWFANFSEGVNKNGIFYHKNTRSLSKVLEKSVLLFTSFQPLIPTILGLVLFSMKVSDNNGDSYLILSSNMQLNPT